MKSLRRKTIALALAALPCVTLANPEGGQVVAGSATIHQESATKIGITQTTDKAIIDWRSYSIGANEHVQYYQPSAASVTLNRVTGQDPSQILGRLTANGQVFLVNPNGIYFGRNAQIDVAGLVASTHNIHNEDFMAGKYDFNIPGKPGAAVINEGMIRIADTGIAAFVAPSVANRGVVAARLGKVELAAANGFTLDFTGDNLLSFMVNEEVAQTAFDIEGNRLTSFVENSGKIEAQGGFVLLTARAAENAIHGVINHSGVIEATSVGEQNGEIVLSGGAKGVVAVSGTLDASGKLAGETGGRAQITGEKIGLFDGTVIDASGNAGGGTVIVGGDYLGGEASDALMAELGIRRETEDIQVAQSVYFDAKATINTDAIRTGDGGKVVLWSDDSLVAQGTISAQGGRSEGDGGFIETSGKWSLDISGIEVDASSPQGKAGTWLIDPETFTVDNTTVGDIIASLNNGTNSLILADSSIFINEDIVKSAGGNAHFTARSAFIYLQEGRNVVSTSGKLNVSFNATDRVWIGRGWEGGESQILTNGGDVFLRGPNFVGVNGTIDAGIGNIVIQAENKQSTGVDRGIWIYGATQLSGNKVSLLTADNLQVDEKVRIAAVDIQAQTEAQTNQLKNKFQPEESESKDESGSDQNLPESDKGIIDFIPNIASTLHNIFIDSSTIETIAKYLGFEAAQSIKMKQAIIGQAIDTVLGTPSVAKALAGGLTDEAINLIVDLIKKELGLFQDSASYFDMYASYATDVAVSMIKNGLTSQYQAKGNQPLAQVLFSIGFTSDMLGISSQAVLDAWRSSIELGNAKEQVTASMMNLVLTSYNGIKQANLLEDAVDSAKSAHNLTQEEIKLIDQEKERIDRKREIGQNVLNDVYQETARDREINVNEATRIIDVAVRLKEIHDNGGSLELWKNENGKIVPTEVQDLINYAYLDSHKNLAKQGLMLDLIRTFATPPASLIGYLPY